MPEKVDDYCRDLDLTRAVAGVGFTADGVRYTRSAFASMRDRAIVIQLDASKKGALSFSLTQDCKFPFEVTTEGKTLVTRIKGVEHEGIPGGLTAECRTQVVSDGKVAAEDKQLTISGATHVTLLVNAATNYVNYHDISGDESAARPAWRPPPSSLTRSFSRGTRPPTASSTAVAPSSCTPVRTRPCLRTSARQPSRTATTWAWWR